jgi:hypothetical protein
MAAAAAPFGALTPAVTLASAVTVGECVVGYMTHDQRARMFDPTTIGFAPQTGDQAQKWLPKVSVANQVTVNNPGPVGTGTAGPVYLSATWGTSDTVNASSVFDNLVFAPNDIVLTVSATATF